MIIFGVNIRLISLLSRQRDGETTADGKSIVSSERISGDGKATTACGDVDNDDDDDATTERVATRLPFRESIVSGTNLELNVDDAAAIEDNSVDEGNDSSSVFLGVVATE